MMVPLICIDQEVAVQNQVIHHKSNSFKQHICRKTLVIHVVRSCTDPAKMTNTPVLLRTYRAAGVLLDELGMDTMRSLLTAEFDPLHSWSMIRDIPVLSEFQRESMGG